MTNDKHSMIFRKAVLAGVLAAAGVALSVVSIPMGPTKCFPFQHTINVVAGIVLGPWWAVGAAFTTSVIRNLLGTGSLFAFPGSMFGALFVGLAARALPDKYRTVIYLYYIEGYSAKEIAQLLGIPQNTVLSQMARARKLLKTALKGDFDDAL